MALGARGGDVVGMIFKQGATQLGIGMAVGIAFALGVSQLMQIILLDVKPRDPVVFSSVVLTLFTAGLLACLIPARRATKIDPLTALRSQ
jgi:putative ABC transport system permease protein